VSVWQGWEQRLAVPPADMALITPGTASGKPSQTA
jgi:hypothetical protein